MSGLYALKVFREQGLRVVVAREGFGRRRHLVLEPLSGRALRHPEPGVLLRLRRRARAGMGLDRALRLAARDRALPQPHRRPLRPAPRHPPEHRRDRGDVRRGHRHLGGRDRDRRAVPRPVLRHGHRRPVGTEPTRLPRASTPSRARSCRRACGPRKASSSRASASASSGPARRACRPSPSWPRSPRHLTVFQRTAAFTWPSQNKPLTDDEQAAIKARYRELRARAAESFSGTAGTTGAVIFAVPDRRPADPREHPRGARSGAGRTTASARAGSGPTPRRTSTPTRWPSSCSAR